MSARFRLGLAAGLALAAARPGAQTTQTFRASTEVLLVDATVVDRAGAVVPDLVAADFTVSVEGVARQVQSAQFVAAPPRRTTTAPRAGETHVSTNASANRLLVIAVDEAHLPWRAKRSVIPAAARLLDYLGPDDLVSLVRLPGGGGVEFTTDRQRILDGLQQIIRSPAPGETTTAPVNLTDPLPRSSPDIRGSGAAAIEREADLTMKQMVETVSGATVAQSLQTLRASLSAANVPARIVLIAERLLSEATPECSQSRVPGSLAPSSLDVPMVPGIGPRVTIDVVSPDMAAVDMRAPDLAADPGCEQRALRETLAGLARGSGGRFYPVAGAGDAAFDRIGSSLNGYYLLGVEASRADRTGKPLNVRVSVANRDLVVRANNLTLPAAPKRPSVRDLLGSIVPGGSLPLRVATFAAPDSQRTRVRVVVSAEIGDGIQGPVVTQLGLLAIDQQGRVVTQSQRDALSLPAARRGDAPPLLFVESLSVPPGDYTLRLAVLGRDGTAGTVQHALAARLQRVFGDIDVSELVVAEPEPTATAPRILPRPAATGRWISAVMSVAGEEKRLATISVEFAIVPLAGGEPIAAGAALSRSLPGHRREFSVVLPLTGAVQGDYVMRALMTSGSNTPVALERIFRVQ